MDERIHTADNVRRWYILRHPKPEMLNDILSGRKKVFLSADDDAAALPPFEHYIPFADMAYRPSKAEVDPDNYKPYNPILDGEALRADLHSFVFLKVTPRQMEAILQSEWNHALKYWLRPFRGKDGELLVVSDHEMQTFRNAIKCQDFKVCKGIPVENFQNGDRVMVVSGPMQGSEGEVSKIRVREGRATLSIVFSMFNDSLAIEVPNIPFEDVRLKDKEAENLLADDIIAKMEDQLIELLHHRHGKNGSHELSKDDEEKLLFLHRYADLNFGDDKDGEAKFRALMLVCAYLMKDKEATDRQINDLQQLIQGKDTPANHLECYLLTALFIATHDVRLRHNLKNYQKAHEDTLPLPIRRFLSIAKNIKCR